MVDIKTTVETLRGDTTFEEAIGNTLYGVYKDVRFEVYHSPPDVKEYDITRGNTVVKILGPSDDPDSKGGVQFYAERHNIDPSLDLLHSLFKRARSVAKELANNESIHACPYCGFMVHEDWKIERELWPTMRRKYTLLRTQNTTGNTFCTGLKKWLLPVVTIYEHKTDENIFFTDEELADCETLIRTDGYPPELSNSRLDGLSYLKLSRLAEEHPEVFEDDIDVNTLQKILKYCDRDDPDVKQLVDWKKLSYRD